MTSDPSARYSLDGGDAAPPPANGLSLSAAFLTLFIVRLCLGTSFPPSVKGDARAGLGISFLFGLPSDA